MIWCKGLNERCNQNFFSTLFLYLLFHYPNLFLYSQRDPKLFLYSQRGPKLFLYSLFHYPKLFLYSFSLFAISLTKPFSLFSEGPKTFSLIFFSICYFITQHFFSILRGTQNFFSILRGAQNFFSILRGAQDFFSICYFITQNLFSILREAQNIFSIHFLYSQFY